MIIVMRFSNICTLNGLFYLLLAWVVWYLQIPYESKITFPIHLYDRQFYSGKNIITWAVCKQISLFLGVKIVLKTGLLKKKYFIMKIHWCSLKRTKTSFSFLKNILLFWWNAFIRDNAQLATCYIVAYHNRLGSFICL